LTPYPTNANLVFNKQILIWGAKMKFNVILFENFETIDAMGPVEVIGTMNKFKKTFDIEYYSEKGGIIRSIQDTRIDTLPISEIKEADTILIPGGMGIRTEINNQRFIEKIKELAINAKFVLTVCTGSALLAKTGVLKGLKATSNKISWNWVTEQDKDVEWISKARWVKDGKYYTSSGVSAGIDMSLGFIADLAGTQAAKGIAFGMEYVWNEDKDNDPFYNSAEKFAAMQK
jgi:putative intracellular protease/amidase